MKTISQEFAEKLIDFAPTEAAKSMGFARSQMEGAVAAYNMLARNRVAYLADEVGMGKTYVALGVMGLVRHLNPRATVMVMTPRENIQDKWARKELPNFVRQNWQVEDNCFRDLQGGPVHRPRAVKNIYELVDAIRAGDHHDLFLKYSSFQVACRKAPGRRRIRERLLPQIPWIDPNLLRVRMDWYEFRDMLGRILNAVLPPIDLLIIDEAHNFKHGFSDRVSNRNRILGMALGHPSGKHPDCPWLAPKARHVLMLSATPFESDFRDMHNQLSVLGKGSAKLHAPDSDTVISAAALREGDEHEAREAAQRLLIRRMSYLRIKGEKHSKNMYRREWRHGGLDDPDQPMRLTDPRQKLIIGLVQKKITELLGDKQFNNAFQIGMLSSFESFTQTLVRSKKLKSAANHEEDDEEKQRTAVFDGDQTENDLERQGIDSHHLGGLIQSYRDHFGESLPHPKLDAAADYLSEAFETGEKTLVFVRRIATVNELKNKLDQAYNKSIRHRMEAALPAMQDEIAAIFKRYERERSGMVLREDDGGEEEPALDQQLYLADDEGGISSFFDWFFRGKGPKGKQSGAAFQRNRLSNASSVYSTLFEENYVAWLLGRPEDVLGTLAQRLGQEVDELSAALCATAWSHFKTKTQREKAFPRGFVYESYQVAALQLLRDAGGNEADLAEVILHDRYMAEPTPHAGQIPTGFSKDVQKLLGTRTFITELVKRTQLRAVIWPDDHPDAPPRERLRRRELRREMLSALSRLGGAYIDLYLAAIRRIGSFDRDKESEATTSLPPEVQLAVDFLDLLEHQRAEEESGHVSFNAFAELSRAASQFDLIMATNYPGLQSTPLAELTMEFGRSLTAQSPVGGMSGKVNKRLVYQFRMPGYPLVLATTDLLQEGEDLHTHCRRVMHYGIGWTPSSMEQRNGRVDRIGGLVQRKLDGTDIDPHPESLIQVFYPHLEDTVERTQVRRVLERLNQFVSLVHLDTADAPEHASQIDMNQAILEDQNIPPQICTQLNPAYDVRAPWLAGELGPDAVRVPRLDLLEAHFDAQVDKALARLNALEDRVRRPRARSGSVLDDTCVDCKDDDRDHHVDDHHPHQQRQLFTIAMRSQARGDATLVRCSCPAGNWDLSREDQVDALYDLQKALGCARVCALGETVGGSFDVRIEEDRLLHTHTTQPEEVLDLICRTTREASTISHRDLPTGSVRPRKIIDATRIKRMLSAIKTESWQLDGHQLIIQLADCGRQQKLWLGMLGEDLVIRTTCLSAREVTSNVTRWRELACLAWKRNHDQEVVSFGFDRSDRLIGQVRHPYEHLDQNELELYLHSLSTECDRLEYLFTGVDVF